MTFHGVDVKTQFKRMRELAPDVYRAWLEFDGKAFSAGALPVKTKELMALSIAHRGYVLETGEIKMSDDAKKLADSDEVRKAYLGAG